MSSNNIPDIEKIETLQAGQSQYVNPIRVHYTQSGKKKIWDCMKCHDSVSILIYNKTRSVLVFVKQLRPAVLLASRLEDPTSKNMKNSSVTGYTLELCAGILDKEGKSPAEVAQEEVLEETGYQVPVESLKFLSSFRSGVGVTGSLQQSFFCEVEDSQRVGKGGGIGDEQIEVLELGVDEAFEKLWVRDEDCSESRPASMLFALSWFFYEYAPKNNIKIN